MQYRRLFVKNSLIFITIVTKDRKPILTNNITAIHNSFLKVIRIYKFSLVAYSIQPDHIHCIIAPKETLQYPKIVKSFKYSVTRALGYSDSIWQNRYWEHSIINDKDLHKHLDYIHYNPVKHSLVQNVKEWQYSSFAKFVKYGLYEQNWGSYTDVKDIVNLNFE